MSLTKVRSFVIYPVPILLAGMACLCQNGRSGVATDDVPLRIIIVNSEAEAARTLNRLKAGDDFSELARALSVDATAADGGLMGRLDSQTLRPELKNALQGVTPGQFSSVVKVPSGYAILQLLTEEEAVGLKAVDSAKQAAILAEGSIRFTTDVGGYSEALTYVFELPKPEGWGQNLQAVCKGHKDSLAMAMARVEKLLGPISKQSAAAPGKDQEPMRVMQAHLVKAQLHAYQGEMDRAVEQYESAYRIAVDNIPPAISVLSEMLGMAYLHKAEMENGSTGILAISASSQCGQEPAMRKRPAPRKQFSISCSTSITNRTHSMRNGC